MGRPCRNIECAPRDGAPGTVHHTSHATLPARGRHVRRSVPGAGEDELLSSLFRAIVTKLVIFSQGGIACSRRIVEPSSIPRRRADPLPRLYERTATSFFGPKGTVRLRLLDILRARGLTAYALAKFTGLSLNTIYRLTRRDGRFTLIRSDTIERLCAALRVTPTELFGYDEQSKTLNGSTRRARDLPPY